MGKHQVAAAMTPPAACIPMTLRASMFHQPQHTRVKKVKGKRKAAFFIPNMDNVIVAPSSGLSPDAVNSYDEDVEKDFKVASHYGLQDFVPFSIFRTARNG